MGVKNTDLFKGKYFHNGGMFIHVTAKPQISANPLKYTSNGLAWWGVAPIVETVVTASSAILKVINVSYANIKSVAGIAKANILKIINIT